MLFCKLCYLQLPSKLPTCYSQQRMCKVNIYVITFFTAVMQALTCRPTPQKQSVVCNDLPAKPTWLHISKMLVSNNHHQTLKYSCYMLDATCYMLDATCYLLFELNFMTQQTKYYYLILLTQLSIQSYHVTLGVCLSITLLKQTSLCKWQC